MHVCVYVREIFLRFSRLGVILTTSLLCSSLASFVVSGRKQKYEFVHSNNLRPRINLFFNNKNNCLTWILCTYYILWMFFHIVIFCRFEINVYIIKFQYRKFMCVLILKIYTCTCTTIKSNKSKALYCNIYFLYFYIIANICVYILYIGINALKFILFWMYYCIYFNAFFYDKLFRNINWI